MRRLLPALLAACTVADEPSAFDDPGGASLAADLALDHLDLTGAGPVAVERVQIDHLGMAHVRVHQTLDGVPVFGGEAIVHLAPDGSVTTVTDSLAEGVAIDTRPLYDAQEAVDLAGAETQEGLFWRAESPPDLYVLRRGDRDHLAWRVQLERPGPVPARPLVWVDAHTGEVLWAYDNLRTAATTGTGAGNYSGTVVLSIYENEGTYYLEDTVHNLATWTYAGTTDTVAPVTDADDDFSADVEAAAVDAHFAGTAALEYYRTEHGLVGLDGAGGPGDQASFTGTGETITIYVNYGQGWTNAMWNGHALVLGDGDGVVYGPFTSLDVVGHEITHGMSVSVADLVYYGESGAVDESIADVMGAMVERSVEGESDETWLLGEDVVTPGVYGDAIRRMDDPSADGYSVDHYDDLYRGSDDNGGVHINSGIGDLAFYLMAKGGSHPTYGGLDVVGVGADATSAIWFRAVQHYMTSTTDFAGARAAMASAAVDLYGEDSAQLYAVQDAWSLVGIGNPSGENKCLLNPNGVQGHCTPECPCPLGGGDCDSDEDCGPDLACGEDLGEDYGLDWYVDVCVPATCHVADPGAHNYCEEGCPCLEGEGDCDTDLECAEGLVCVADAGAEYGLAWYVDVCRSSCHRGDLGAQTYCSADCPCEAGEGDCDGDDECVEGAICGLDNGADYGLTWYVDACMPDCHEGDLGKAAYCSSECPCLLGQGDCDSDDDCHRGLVCGVNNGAPNGFAWYTDVCAATCHSGSNGDQAYCSPQCPCAQGQGDCDSDLECEAGLSCRDNHGAAWGLKWFIDVCE